MALGLTARVTRKFIWDKGSGIQFSAAAVAAVEDLNWKLEEITPEGLVAHTRVSIRSAGEEVRINFKNNQITIKSECIGIQPIAFGKNRSNIKKFIKRFKETSLLITDNDVVKNYFSINERQKENKGKNQSVITNSKEKLSDFFALFFSGKDFYFTSKILALNVLIYLVMLMTGAYNDNHFYELFYNFGGIHRGLINDGEWWRFFTAAFVHGGFLHLFFNMYAFLYVSLILEPLLGRFRYLFVYLALAVLSGLSTIYWFSNMISIGASGAIFGLYGVTFAMAATGVLKNRIRISLLISIAVFSGYNIGFGIEDGIDYAAHIGGFSWGIIIGLLISPFYMENKKTFYKIISSSVLGVLILGFSFYVSQYIMEKPAIYIRRNPIVGFIIDSNLSNQKDSNSHVYKDMESFSSELNQFWHLYNKASRNDNNFESDERKLIQKLEYGIMLLNKDIKLLYRLSTLDISPLARSFIEEAAYSCNAKGMLYQAYIKAMKNPSYNYHEFLAPLIALSIINNSHLRDYKYNEFMMDNSDIILQMTD